MTAATLLIMAVTAVLYALPLSRGATETTSNLSFFLLQIVACAAAGVAIAATSGWQRRAWVAILASWLGIAVLFGLDPQVPGGDLTVALDAAFVNAAAFTGAVLILCRPALRGVATTRTISDVLWLTTALLVTFWTTMVEPVAGILGRSAFESAMHSAFLLGTLLLTVIVITVVPHTSGTGRYVLWLLGAGGACVCVAGVLHIRFFYEGTLEFGSGFDYLWTLGIGALALAALIAGDHPLEFRWRGTAWHIALTLVPLGPALISLSLLEPEIERPFAVLLVTTLALRVIALLIENDRLTRILAAEAANDPLTGLGNRRTLTKGLVEIGASAARTTRWRVVMTIDIDHFKAINDDHGHLVGDQVLTIVGERLRHTVRDDAALIRFGGDEFIVAFDLADLTDVDHAAERVRSTLSGRYELDETVLDVSVTIGVCVDDGSHGVPEILQTADEALYDAKAAGRGRVHFHHMNADPVVV
ncbi:MAG: GGDEF domain-containing protein [Actinomycetota bacterium]